MQKRTRVTALTLTSIILIDLEVRGWLSFVIGALAGLAMVVAVDLIFDEIRKDKG